ncbi:MAG TPA: hypothetical protein DD789_04005 [Firmicutes bacterium]|jgi:hypothetical protein|nr:hypothetical protein [Bacillota bacterium]
MKKTIPFEIFGANQSIYFDILRLAELEKALGCSINDIIQRQDAGVHFCLAALPIGMKQHYHKPTAAFFAEKIEEHLATEGASLDDIAVPIVKAILASGIFGKEVADRAISVDGELDEEDEETDPTPKNVKKETAAKK